MAVIVLCANRTPNGWRGWQHSALTVGRSADEALRRALGYRRREWRWV